MKKLRPTIPVHEWKLSINLKATREIQNQSGNPAFDCNCQSCMDWRSSFKEFFPTELLGQLQRVGIDLEHPTDLYQYNETNDGSSLRIVYHAVGKILEGPNQWTKNEMGDVLMYREVRQTPYVSIVVFPQSQSYDHAPVLENTASGDLVRLDLRLLMPSKYCRSGNVPGSA
ncbi:hypothetical protein ACCI51_09380 [Microbulbifer echini]|uniref:Uncharacterized protein n=1 Tax=Microbulbifer echini TaxID=1529067 RepID=A0ABV4NN27_9GAMM